MQNLVIDIAHRGVIPPIHVTEYDSMSRFFQITLLDNGAPYTPPDLATYSIRYEVGLNNGWYDTITLPDETQRGAISVDGNVFTIEIAEDATHGNGTLALVILGDGNYQLAVTGIRIYSDYLPAESAGETQNYYNVLIAPLSALVARAEAAAEQAIEHGISVVVSGEQLVITHAPDAEEEEEP